MVATFDRLSALGAEGCPVENGLHRCPPLLDALGRMLKMTVALIDPHGHAVSSHSFSGGSDSTARHFTWPGGCCDLFRQIPQVYRDLPRGEIIFDPTEFPASLARLENGYYLLMGGPSDPEEKHPYAALSRGFSAVIVSEQGDSWDHSVTLSAEEKRENLECAAQLFNTLNRYLFTAEQPALLSAIEQAGKLALSTFDPERFDFGAILDLFVSLLLTIAGGGGAFAFSYEYPGRTITAQCGEYAEFLQGLSEEWRELGQSENPGKAFVDRVGARAGHELSATVKGICRHNNGASVYLGLIGAEGSYLPAALRALSRKASIALGVSSLLTMFQYGWKTVFNSLRQGIIVTDSRGTILLKNRAAKTFMKNRGFAPATGRLVKDCGLGRQIEEAIFSATRNGCSFKLRRSTVGEGDEAIHLRWDVVPLLRDDGRNDGAILVFSNITASTLLHQEIQDWERLAAAGEVAAGLAHEIRNPLATAKAAVQLVRMDEARLKRDELLSTLDRELDRMGEILTKFINIAKPKKENKLEPVNLDQVLQELLFLLSSEAMLREIELITRLPEGGSPVVLGSANSIKQVCLNIARNAFEAMESGGKLTVSLISKKGRAHIVFQDTGPGIPAENITALTRPFFTTKPEGTGLGLAVSSSILKTMGGTLEIESNPGRGTAVDLILPLYLTEL
ncbi:MAG TPA: PAS domain-containing protein [Firmicutes bacterium]|jgi:signal transduction histidine kinase|nr:PAS domain-containing protein [Bacillota bacterium]